MNKKYFLVFSLIVLVSLFSVTFALAQECSDSDSGIDDYTTKGTVTGVDSNGNSIELIDYCGFGVSVPNYGQYGLYELGCQDGVVKYSFTLCPSGKSCVNGACGGSLGENTGSSSGSCTDTDRGRDDFTTKGIVKGLDSNGNSVERTDMCGKGQSVPYYGQDGLYEYYCANGAVYADFVPCVGTCSNGACQVASQEASQAEACKDSDNGKNYSVKGIVVSTSGIGTSIKTDQKEDTCAGEKAVYEYYCDSPSYYYSGMKIEIKQDYHFCDKSEICSEGACIRNQNYTLIEVKPNETGAPIEMLNVSEIETEQGKVVEVVCLGCLKDNKCYPLGYVKSAEYCSDDGNFTAQKDESESCENLFECKSGVCVSGECISEGFIQKILNWFKKLFG